MKCFKCGTEITEDVMFCPKCMTRIADAVKAPQNISEDVELERTVGVAKLSDIEMNSAVYERKNKENEAKHILEKEYNSNPKPAASYVENNPVPPVEPYVQNAAPQVNFAGKSAAPNGGRSYEAGMPQSAEPMRYNASDINYGNAYGASAPYVEPQPVYYKAQEPVEYYPDTPHGYYTPEKKEKKRGNNTVLFAIVGALSAILIIVLILVFCTDLFKGSKPAKKSGEEEKTYKCAICDEEVDEGQEHCSDCEEKFRCELCDKVKDDVEDGYCDKCRANYKCNECGKIEANVENGVCTSCVLRCKTDGCNEIIEEGYFCEVCLSNIEGGEPLCSYCEEIVDPEDIFIITTNAEGFCKDCAEEQEHYCEECGAVLSAEDDDDMCLWCADHYCTECNEVLKEREVEEIDGEEYCEDCAEEKRPKDEEPENEEPMSSDE